VAEKVTIGNKVFFGDCRDTMRDLIAQGVKVQMCVTSPPYFGLRDYGHPGQLGLESTPAEFVQAMVDVFALVRELLADDGVLWLNLGDSYARQGGTGKKARHWDGRNKDAGNEMDGFRLLANEIGLKPKDLIGIPWRVAFALQEAGWYLRQDIIWHKPNPMPESVTDRCTKAHEYLFLLSKNERYYFDSASLREPVSEATIADGRQERGARGTKGEYAAVDGNCGFASDGLRNKRSVWTVNTVPYSGAHFATFPPALIEPCILAGSRSGDTVLDCFFGSGTTGEVAGNLGRNWIGCEINDQYAPLQWKRTSQKGFCFEDAKVGAGDTAKQTDMLTTGATNEQ
jgi:DNA modification methylase